jgi:hypothetical protein
MGLETNSRRTRTDNIQKNLTTKTQRRIKKSKFKKLTAKSAKKYYCHSELCEESPELIPLLCKEGLGEVYLVVIARS